MILNIVALRPDKHTILLVVVDIALDALNYGQYQVR
jgi:hypothetical protein